MKINFLQLKNLYSRAFAFAFHSQLGRFLVVGASAFVVNLLLLFALHGLLHLTLLPAQLLGAQGTIIFSFLLHHNWTYKSYNEKPLALRFVEFNISALAGSAISTFTVLGSVHYFRLHYLVGLSIGALLAICWNYMLNQYFVWANRTNKIPIIYEEQ